MLLEISASNEEFAHAIESLGLFANESHGTVNALSRFVRMQRLLKDDEVRSAKERQQVRRTYLAEVKSFEEQIRQIRTLKRIEMSRSSSWDFPAYLKGAWTILACRTSFRAAYFAHALGVDGVSSWVESAAYRALNAVFFDLGELQLA